MEDMVRRWYSSIILFCLVAGFAVLAASCIPNADLPVYVSGSGDHYHRPDCRYVDAGSRRISLAEAFASGYDPCSECNPPLYAPKTVVAGSTETSAPDFSRGIRVHVVSVHDGDTLTVLSGESLVKVRLLGIDSPELSQAFGKPSRDALSSLTVGKEVILLESGTDRYGRVLGDVMVDDIWVNAFMVENGLAWHYTDYSDDERLSRLEEESRRTRSGLWGVESPQPPWDYRKSGRMSQ